ncbi:Dihydroxy-acid dehydratase [Verticillium dahliae VDG2]|nr:Dihydroxy-acid dehydratase [Verticillium dahliae VDG2]
MLERIQMPEDRFFSAPVFDIFFTQDAHAAPSLCPPESRRLSNKQDLASSGVMEYYRELIQTYSDEVNIDQLSPRAATATSPASSSLDRTEALVAFQISTNAAIRRFLNSLLRITEDLWSFHGAIYRTLPGFLLTSRPRKPTGSPATPGFPSYIIHRPFIEYVLLNVGHFATHPCREAVLERCQLCLLGCQVFIHVFDVDPTNSVTGPSAAGMVTFAMVIILRVATMCPVFCDILPAEIERAIVVGGRNLRRFSGSVREFEWHLGVLEKLEESCRRNRGDE